MHKQDRHLEKFEETEIKESVAASPVYVIVRILFTQMLR